MRVTHPDFPLDKTVSDTYTSSECTDMPLDKLEAICPVTGYSYNRYLPSSPHVGPDGIPY